MEWKEKMMEVVEEVLLEYEEADSNKRLHMFLQFRDLRLWFQEIENTALTDQIRSNAVTHASKLRTYLSPGYMFLKRAYSTLFRKLSEVGLSRAGKLTAR